MYYTVWFHIPHKGDMCIIVQDVKSIIITIQSLWRDHLFGLLPTFFNKTKYVICRFKNEQQNLLSRDRYDTSNFRCVLKVYIRFATRLHCVTSHLAVKPRPSIFKAPQSKNLRCRTKTRYGRLGNGALQMLTRFLFYYYQTMKATHSKWLTIVQRLIYYFVVSKFLNNVSVIRYCYLKLPLFV